MSQFHDKKERFFMRKVTKLVIFLMTFALLLTPGVSVFAGDINDLEAELIEIGNGTFVYKGVEYIATDAAKQRVVNYLMRDDVDLNAEQAEEAKDLFWGNLAKGISDGYLVRLHPEEPEEEQESQPSGGDWSDEESSEPVTETVVTYTYTDMTATMYAKQAVNLRNQPSTDGAKIGSLSENQEVVVTGQCTETGWYRIEYNGGVAYVSNNYLLDSKPEVETEAGTELATEMQETEQPETEQVTENTAVSTEVIMEVETDPESEEVVLREKNFHKNADVMALALVMGAATLGIAAGMVLSHRSNNRRYRK